jgi:hypothetical protein
VLLLLYMPYTIPEASTAESRSGLVKKRLSLLAYESVDLSPATIDNLLHIEIINEMKACSSRVPIHVQM